MLLNETLFFLCGQIHLLESSNSGCAIIRPGYLPLLILGLGCVCVRGSLDQEKLKSDFKDRTQGFLPSILVQQFVF